MDMQEWASSKDLQGRRPLLDILDDAERPGEEMWGVGDTGTSTVIYPRTFVFIGVSSTKEAELVKGLCVE